MGRSRGRQIITGLDVGTTKICCVIAEWSAIGTLDIVGVGTSPSRGLRKGVVVNIDSTVESIKQAVGDAEEMAGVEIASVLAGVAGGHIRGVNSRGVIAVSGKHREVSQADVDRALDAARAINLPQDREIIHALPQAYVVDDQDGVKEPLGMSGVRLEVEVHLVTGATTSVRNVVRSVNRAGLQVQDIVLEPLASAEAVLSDEEKELGILLIDLGGGTTDVALFRDGAVWHTSILPLGGDHISNDLAYGLRIPLSRAEQLKIEHGSALVDDAIKGQILSQSGELGRPLKNVNLEHLRRIMSLRIEEIFQLIGQDLQQARALDYLRAGVFLCGGGARIPQIATLAEHVLEMPVSIGKTNSISGLKSALDQPEFATAIGLVKFGSFQQRKRSGRGSLTEGLKNTITSFFKRP
jgi:cell division protein FtsA